MRKVDKREKNKENDGYEKKPLILRFTDWQRTLRLDFVCLCMNLYYSVWIRMTVKWFGITQYDYSCPSIIRLCDSLWICLDLCISLWHHLTLFESVWPNWFYLTIYAYVRVYLTDWFRVPPLPGIRICIIIHKTVSVSNWFNSQLLMSV